MEPCRPNGNRSINIFKVAGTWMIMLLATLNTSGCGAINERKMDDLLARSKPEDWGVLELTEKSRDIRRDMQMRIIRSHLKDPDSAKFSYYSPRRGSAVLDGKAVLVWYEDVDVNAKNAFGGYTGFKKYSFEYACKTNIPGDCKLTDYAIPHYRYENTLDWQK